MSSRKRRSQRGVEVSATHTCYYEEEQKKMQGPNWRDASGDRERGHTMQWHLQAIYTTFRGEGGQDGYDWNTVTPASNDTTCLEGVSTDRRLHDTATPANRSDTSLGVSTDRRLNDTTIHTTNRGDTSLGVSTDNEETTRYLHPLTAMTQALKGSVECCFTSTETVGLLGTGAQNGHLYFHTAPEIWLKGSVDWQETTRYSNTC